MPHELAKFAGPPTSAALAAMVKNASLGKDLRRGCAPRLRASASLKHVQSIGAELKATCAECAVEVYESPMSVTGMINVGTGAVTLGFAAEDYAFALPRGTAG